MADSSIGYAEGRSVCIVLGICLIIYASANIGIGLRSAAFQPGRTLFSIPYFGFRHGNQLQSVHLRRKLICTIQSRERIQFTLPCPCQVVLRWICTICTSSQVVFAVVEVSDRGLLLESSPGCCRWIFVPGVALSMAFELHAEGRRDLLALISQLFCRREMQLWKVPSRA